MKWLFTILGFLLALIGVVWILQGFNMLMGSMMSGHSQYAVLGIVAVVIGVALIVFANRRVRKVP
jgi:uncharacterized membrane protein HdeD (DUF308 family)